MKKEEIINFIKKFNEEPPFTFDMIHECTDLLSDDDLKLFIVLSNFKNGNDFKRKFKGGKF